MKRNNFFIKNYCAKHNLTFELSIWDKQQHPKAGIEAAGRKFRYEFFRNVMKKI
ncbi:ATP-binding protein [Apilactobacillus ozensis]|uniref:ATP-binding protein n=1 Tax=Apilactobacillus ozensis TaxID=866801 RepID=UPI000B30CB9A